LSHAGIAEATARPARPRWGESVISLMIGTLAASCGLFVIVTQLAALLRIPLPSHPDRWFWLAIAGETVGGLGYAWSARGKRGRSLLCLTASLICGGVILLLVVLMFVQNVR
jgi:hypothetical protein